RLAGRTGEPGEGEGEHRHSENRSRSPCPPARWRGPFLARLSCKLRWVGDLIHETLREFFPGRLELGRSLAGARRPLQHVEGVMPRGCHARSGKQSATVDIWRNHSNM